MTGNLKDPFEIIDYEFIVRNAYFFLALFSCMSEGNSYVICFSPGCSLSWQIIQYLQAQYHSSKASCESSLISHHIISAGITILHLFGPKIKKKIEFKKIKSDLCYFLKSMNLMLTQVSLNSIVLLLMEDIYREKKEMRKYIIKGKER